MAGLAAFVAGVGGGLLAITLGSSLTSNYTTLGGEVWLVVLVTSGLRSNAAAMVAGLSQTLLGGVALVYLPKVFGNFIAIAFGLGAIAIVRFPDGALTYQARRVRAVLVQIRESTPSLFRALRVGGIINLVALVVLVLAAKNLWWLWLAITYVLLNVTFGYLFVKTMRRPTPVVVAAEETPRPGMLETVDVG
jgi:hypothetical protein